MKCLAIYQSEEENISKQPIQALEDPDPAFPKIKSCRAKSPESPFGIKKNDEKY